MEEPNKELDELVNEILTTFDPKMFQDLVHRIRKIPPVYYLNVFKIAYKRIVDLPLIDLPKFVNHPSGNIRGLINKRLAGKVDFRWLDLLGESKID